jgi:sirohydrochlorin cobaltochelatase
MASDDFSDATLLLVGHGGLLDAGVEEPVCLHAAELRRRGLFAQVVEGFLKREPSLVHSMQTATAARVFVVPLFISEGYFSEQVVPRELGFRTGDAGGLSRVRQRGGRTLFYCRPVGTHPRMTDVILDRAKQVVAQHPFPRAPNPADVALHLVGHGTPQDENSRKAIEQQAERLRGLNLYAEVHAVFLDEAPRIGECYTLTQTRHLVAVPCFINEGLHTQQDIPVQLGAPERVVQARRAAGQPPWRNPTEHRDKLVWYAASVGSDPLVAEVILERVREAVAWGGLVGK